MFLKKDKRLGVAQGKRRYDLPLNKSIGTGFLIVLIALMTFLAVMAVATSFALGSMTQRWSSGLENKITIEIPAEKSDGALRTQADVKNLQTGAAKRLRALPYIKTVDLMSDVDIQELISPWLGESGALNDIPLPGLISLEMHSANPENIRKLESEMGALSPDIKIDTHESWLGDLLRLTGALQFAAISVALIIGITTVTAIAGAIRTRMAVHREEVELLHLMGARDEYITRQLQRHAIIIALKGSMLGLMTGVVALMLISTISGETATALLPSFHFGILHILALIAIPGLACLIAAGAARFTVLRALALMP